MHGLCPKAHQRCGLGQGERAGSNQRAVLAQGVACHHRRFGAPLGAPGAQRGDTGHQHHRLGVGGQGQGLFRAFVNELTDVLAQSLGGLGQGCAYRRVVAPGVQHAHSLGALAGKDKSKWFHGCLASVIRDDGRRRQRDDGKLAKGWRRDRSVLAAQKSSSTAPQVKPPPTPSSMRVSPFLILPLRTAASSARGMEAAEVLPC